jgi:hypothetical protein
MKEGDAVRFKVGSGPQGPISPFEPGTERPRRRIRATVMKVRNGYADLLMKGKAGVKYTGVNVESLEPDLDDED